MVSISQPSEKIDIASFGLKELSAYIKSIGQPSYRAGQIFSWLHRKLVSSFDEMSDLPKALRERLKAECILKIPAVRTVQISKTDGTRKYLFELYDGNTIESVFMKYSFGNSVCVSSQVGCAMGCIFCASAIGGCVRNLSTSEILSQVYEISKDTGERISHVVMMGMGEPLLNYSNVVDFVRILSNENALHISQRNITISTCGIAPAIKRLSGESLKITLALSLHAPDDEIRRKIMPVASRYPMEEVLEACRVYFNNTGRRVTFEYCLIGGVNDSKECALRLSGRLKGMNAHVNLIPVNPTENNISASGRKNTEEFMAVLEKNGIAVTKRRELGRDIDGACGQLKRRMV